MFNLCLSRYFEKTLTKYIKNIVSNEGQKNIVPLSNSIRSGRTPHMSN